MDINGEKVHTTGKEDRVGVKILQDALEKARNSGEHGDATLMPRAVDLWFELMQMIGVTV